ncbi:MAG TPA: class IV adenylate cyclase [Lacipirellulaceae bacterium]|nr:class IV adenylate cyclase [Lacipirellulaceae bacterium]
MRYEVEQKHRVSDLATLISRLNERGASFVDPIEQSDKYFDHPCRDFAKTDEAVRIRTVGNHSFVTYKGPKLDSTTKTRREIELPLDADDKDGARFAELLTALGFTPVAVVHKQRCPFRIRVGNYEVEGALDDVTDVGSFVELELQADDSMLDAAKRSISQLASDLNLGPSERRSYLELLLEKSA